MSILKRYPNSTGARIQRIAIERLECSWCGALAGENCRRSGRGFGPFEYPRTYAHATRWNEARDLVFADDLPWGDER